MRQTFLPNWGWLLVLLVATPALITLVLFWKEWSVYALIVYTIIGLVLSGKNLSQSRKPKTA
ncbi:hypothetical protein ACNKHN_03270 [Shigella flexneri]